MILSYFTIIVFRKTIQIVSVKYMTNIMQILVIYDIIVRVTKNMELFFIGFV